MTTHAHRTAAATFAAFALAIPAVQTAGSTAADAADYGATVTSVRYVSGDDLRVTGDVTCPAGHFYDLQVVATQKNGAWGARTVGGVCTGELQGFTVVVGRYISIYEPTPSFKKGPVTTDLYGGSYLCDEFTCNDLNLANHKIQRFVLR